MFTATKLNNLIFCCIVLKMSSKNFLSGDEMKKQNFLRQFFPVCSTEYTTKTRQLIFKLILFLFFQIFTDFKFDATRGSQDWES